MEKQIQLFVNVDNEGNIITSYHGENIIAADPYEFFFLTDVQTVEDIGLYKVVMVGMKPTLVLKENAQ
ncbi:hypothetical protein C7437_1011010 [Psychrobacillus insolitus]|uniref:Uncharacterized protein n=1 Tax=Psychrobacillus insolitus TaxID=1461 RepID=A0A2W7MMX8_9BACI|nr:hypothetical protein [Psychrobacillus insolitus]PZX07888.1 hypothetical protein C7437_1011010 [Psychrobacillus insolitus]